MFRVSNRFSNSVIKLSSRSASSLVAEHGHQFNEATLAAAKPFESIPSFTKLPLVGTAWIYFPIIGRYDRRKDHSYFHEKRLRFGDIFRESIGSKNVVVSFNPEDLKTLMKNEGIYPSRGSGSSAITAYRKLRKEWFLSPGILGEGEDWLETRLKTQKHMLKPKAIHAFIDPMQDVARDFVRNIFDIMDYDKDNQNFLHEIDKWAIESVAVVCLDTRLGCLDKYPTKDSDGLKMINASKMMMVYANRLQGSQGSLLFWKIFPTPTWKKFVTEADIYMKTVFKHIDRSLEKLKNLSDDEKDLTLLQTVVMDKDLGLQRAKTTIADMMFGGIELIALTVGFLLFHLAKNPEKQDILYNEIKRLLPRKDDRMTTEIYNELRYLKACIRESQRLLPVLSKIYRKIDHDIVLGGYRVPAGTLSVVALGEIYMDERYYNNPLQYHPERWIQKDEKFHPFAFLPFGVGPRSCIGRRLAELEIVILTTEIIRNLKIENKTEDIKLLTSLMNKPDRPLKFRFLER